jgi:hypothetical protein
VSIKIRQRWQFVQVAPIPRHYNLHEREFKNERFYKTPEEARRDSAWLVRLFNEGLYFDQAVCDQVFDVVPVFTWTERATTRFWRSLKDALKTNDVAGGLFIMGAFIQIITLIMGGVALLAGSSITGDGLGYVFGIPAVFLAPALFGFLGGASIEMEPPVEKRLGGEAEQVVMKRRAKASISV